MWFEEWKGGSVREGKFEYEGGEGGRFAPLMRNVLISTLAAIQTGKCQSLPNVPRAYKR